MHDVTSTQPDISFIRKLKSSGGDSLSKCYQCATCSTVCNLSPDEQPFPRKEMIWAQWGRKDKLVADPDIWLCHQCNDCSDRCPREAKPGALIAAMRRFVFEHYAFPSFMGRLLASPSGLPVLLLIPILIIGAFVIANTGGDFGFFSDPHVKFGNFIPDMYLEIVFVIGNVMIFTFAAIGMTKFYNVMRSSSGLKQSKGFIPALFSVAITVMGHSNFRTCDGHRYRNTAHLLVFFGFVGALITTAIAVAAIFVFNQHPPFPLTHPIKLLGNVSGFAIVTGLFIMIFRNTIELRESGNLVYGHRLFLWTLLIVTLTGLGSQFFRIAELPVLAYPTYFVHLVAVFFLLWYAPYSQFGHMFYRTLALIYAQTVNRRVSELKSKK